LLEPLRELLAHAYASVIAEHDDRPPPSSRVSRELFLFPCTEDHPMSEYPLAALAASPTRTPSHVSVGNDLNGRLQIGEGTVTVMAGPCSVEGRDMLLDTAHAVRASGAVMLRGGAFKPRSSPYAFRGL